MDPIGRVWLIEYAARPGHADADAYGVADIRALGFRPTMTVSMHRSAITLFVR